MAIMPIRRDLKFKLPADKISTWQNEAGPQLGQFMNTLSILFPVGERFFMDSVRNYRDQITDPELKKAVTAFIGQEAMHGREHQEYNEALFAEVPFAAKVESAVGSLLKFIQDKTPSAFQLSGTIALEHFTAIMADGLLKDPRLLEHADAHYANIWNWHALEETEHKAVAFDVWKAVMKPGVGEYSLRVSGLVIATVILWSVVIPSFLRVVQQQGQLTNLKGWRQYFHYSFGRVGFVRKLVGPWADYLRPSFHPWDHDNKHFLENIEKFVAQVERASKPMAKAA